MCEKSVENVKKSVKSAETILPFSCRPLVLLCNTIAHKKITELIPKQFRFGNSSTQITEHNSQNNLVMDSVILCSHLLPRPSNSRKNSVR